MPTCSSAGPKSRALLAFHVNQWISAYFSLLLSRPPGSGPLKDQQALSASFSYFLIVDSGPPGPGPLKDQQFSRQEYGKKKKKRIQEYIDQYWLLYPPRARYFLPPWPPIPLSTWCCQVAPATQAVASAPYLALTGANPSPPGQPQEQIPVEDTHAEVEIKPQLKPRGSVAKEEDPRPSHQLY